MSKVVIIGIDGFDPFLLDKWKEVLPNFKRMIESSRETTVESTFPPDSICAWTSIYTGKTPAEHGLIESIDYLSTKKLKNGEDRTVYFKGKTFWDAAGSNGKKVCVINPFIAYPAWDVNGVMVSGPVFEGGNTSTFPEGILLKYKFPPLGGIVDFPEEKELDKFIKRSGEITEQLADVSLKVYEDVKPDLFFLTFLTLDRIKHFLWRFTDKEDIYYPGENPYRNAIKDFYLIFDGIIGRFMKLLSEDSVLLVISDHGHRRRCSKSLNLNELLRRKGYLVTSSKGPKGAIKMLIEMAKVFVLSNLSRFGFHDWIYKIAKFIPNRKALKKSTYLIDNISSTVVLSNLCGANPYGGIDVKIVQGEEYIKICGDIINELMNLNYLLGENIVKWAKKREEIYKGEHEGRLPDILFELDEEYGVGMNFYTKLVTPNYTHKKISGGHKREAVLLAYSATDRFKNIKRPVSVVGLSDYILRMLES